jgi:hypothetical protein
MDLHHTVEETCWQGPTLYEWESGSGINRCDNFASIAAQAPFLLILVLLLFSP